MPGHDHPCPNNSRAEITRHSGADRTRLRLLARLADVVLNPVGHVDPSRCEMPPLAASMVSGATMNSAFRRPLQRIVASQLGLAAVKWMPVTLCAEIDNAGTRLAVLLLTSEQDQLLELGRTAACGVLSARMKGVMRKSDRQVLQQALGADLFALATHEAQLRCPALADLDLLTAPLPLSEPHGSDVIRRELTGFGLRILCRFVDEAAPCTARLLELRLATDVAPQRRMQEIAPFGTVHLDQMAKLLFGRLVKWPNSIG